MSVEGIRFPNSVWRLFWSRGMVCHRRYVRCAQFVVRVVPSFYRSLYKSLFFAGGRVLITPKKKKINMKLSDY